MDPYMHSARPLSSMLPAVPDWSGAVGNGRDHSQLETLLNEATITGLYYCHGSINIPMPVIDIPGIGTLASPIPLTQIKQLVELSTQAPYGRGEDTIVDTSVRNVKQITTDQFSITNSGWSTLLLAAVQSGLGLQNAVVTMELYKLLVYETGGFFAAHRDSEKRDHMFGTLVVVLPSPHTGGELLLSHADDEMLIDLSDCMQAGKLTHAAFYADVQHEVLPVVSGHRVCLVYNLLRSPTTTSVMSQPVHADVGAVASLVNRALNDSVDKLVWVFEHQYTQQSMTWSTLKGIDSAVAHVLQQVAKQLDCDVYLTIINVFESGSAEECYTNKRGRYEDEEVDSEMDEEGDEYDDDDDGYGYGELECVEVLDSSYTLTVLKSSDDGGVVCDGLSIDVYDELVPRDRLQGVESDEIEFSEATGNEGASFERSYRRAGIVIWRTSRWFNVLLAGKPTAAYDQLITALDDYLTTRKTGVTAADTDKVVNLAGQLITCWGLNNTSRQWAVDGNQLMHRLIQLDNRDLLQQYINNVVAVNFTGAEQENLLLLRALPLVDQSTTVNFVKQICGRVRYNFPLEFPVNLVIRYCNALHQSSTGTTANTSNMITSVCAIMIASLPDFTFASVSAEVIASLWLLLYRNNCGEPLQQFTDRVHASKADTMRSLLPAFVIVIRELVPDANAATDGIGTPAFELYYKHLIKRYVEAHDALQTPGFINMFKVIHRRSRSHAFLIEVANQMLSLPYTPVEKFMIPAVISLANSFGNDIITDASFLRLYQHACRWLLDNTKYIPVTKPDYHMMIALKCHCEDCLKLSAFLQSSTQRQEGFRSNQDRRAHVLGKIASHQLNVTHTITKVSNRFILTLIKGEPDNVRQRRVYMERVASMKTLLQYQVTDADIHHQVRSTLSAFASTGK